MQLGAVRGAAHAPGMEQLLEMAAAERIAEPKHGGVAMDHHANSAEEPLTVVSDTEIWRGRQKMRRRVAPVEEEPRKRCSCKKAPLRQDPYGTLHANWLVARDGHERALATARCSWRLTYRVPLRRRPSDRRLFACAHPPLPSPPLRVCARCRAARSPGSPIRLFHPLPPHLPDDAPLDYSAAAHEHKSGIVNDGGIAPMWDPLDPEHRPVVQIPWAPILRSFNTKSCERILQLAIWDHDVGPELDDLIGEGFVPLEQLMLAAEHPSVQVPSLENMSIFLTQPKPGTPGGGEEEEDAMHGMDGGSAGASGLTRMGGDSAGQLFIGLKLIDAIDERGATLEVTFKHAIGLKDREKRSTSLNDSYDPTLLLMWIPIILVYLAVGILYYVAVCDFALIDAFYFCWVTFTTVGYGDHSGFGTFYIAEGDRLLPSNLNSAFTSFYMLAGVLVMGVAATLILDLGSHMTARVVHWGMRQEKKLYASMGWEEPTPALAEEGEEPEEAEPLTGGDLALHRVNKIKTGLCNPAFIDVFITIVSVLLVIVGSAFFFMQYEGVSFLQGFYFACATCTTVGCVSPISSVF